jgi:hypothetical protein
LHFEYLQIAQDKDSFGVESVREDVAMVMAVDAGVEQSGARVAAGTPDRDNFNP